MVVHLRTAGNVEGTHDFTLCHVMWAQPYSRSLPLGLGPNDRLQYPEERMTCRLVAFIFVGMGLGHNCPFTGHAELGKDLQPLPINLHLGSSWHMPEPKLRPT